MEYCIVLARRVIRFEDGRRPKEGAGNGGDFGCWKDLSSKSSFSASVVCKANREHYAVGGHGQFLVSDDGVEAVRSGCALLELKERDAVAGLHAAKIAQLRPDEARIGAKVTVFLWNRMPSYVLSNVIPTNDPVVVSVENPEPEAHAPLLHCVLTLMRVNDKYIEEDVEHGVSLVREEGIGRNAEKVIDLGDGATKSDFGDLVHHAVHELRGGHVQIVMRGE